MGRKPKKPEPEHMTVTRYYTPDGRVCPKSTPGAIKCAEKTETYCVRLTDPKTGKRTRQSLGTRDAGEAWRLLRELLVRREKEEMMGLLGGGGGLSPEEEAKGRHASRPLTEHLDEWLADLKNEGKTGAGQLALLEGRTKKLAELAGWRTLADVSKRSANEALARLQTERSRGMAAGHDGRGNRTRNHYLRHLKQFCKWCVDDGRLARSPVAAVKPLNVEVDSRHARRSPTEAEIGLLMAYLEEGEEEKAAVRCDMTGPQRALGYRLCMATGLRAKELRTLQPVNFDLSEGAATVTCRAAYGKNRRLAVQHLPAWLAEELSVWLAEGKPLWGRMPANWPGRLLAADQEACGIEHCTTGAKGERLYFDFHSLRHWYCTWAANRPGISPKTLQAMARHQDARTTMDVYAKPMESEIRKVVGDLPDLRRPK